MYDDRVLAITLDEVGVEQLRQLPRWSRTRYVIPRYGMLVEESAVEVLNNAVGLPSLDAVVQCLMPSSWRNSS